MAKVYGKRGEERERLAMENILLLATLRLGGFLLN